MNCTAIPAAAYRVSKSITLFSFLIVFGIVLAHITVYVLRFLGAFFYISQTIQDIEHIAEATFAAIYSAILIAAYSNAPPELTITIALALFGSMLGVGSLGTLVFIILLGGIAAVIYAVTSLCK